MSTEHRGISVVKEAGYHVPDAMLTSVIKAYPSGFGMVVEKKGGGLDIEVVSGQAKLNDLKKIQKAFENKRLQFFFGNFPTGFISDSIQPFRLLVDSGKNAILSCTMVGDFKKHMPSGDSKHSSEWWAANNVLLPKLQQIFRLCKEDMASFHVELGSSQMKKDISSLIGLQGGMISLFLAMPENPVIMHLQKSMPTYKKFQWGDTSDVLDYVTGIAVTNEEQHTINRPVKAKGPISFVIEEDDDEVETPIEEPVNTPVEEPQKQDEQPIITPSEEPKQREHVTKTGGILRSTVVNGKEVVLWFPPLDMTKRRVLRKAYKEVSGRDLSNQEIQNRVGVVPKDPAFLKDFKELGKSIERLSRSTKIPNKVVSGSDAPRHQAPKAEVTNTPAKNKVTGSTVIAEVASSEGEKDTHPAGGTPIYSVLTSKDKYDTMKYLKTLDKNGQKILDPTRIQDIENTVSHFYKEIGYDGAEQTFGWDAEVRYNIAKASPRAMAIWSGDLLRIIANLYKELDTNTDPAVAEEEEEVTVTFGKKKTA